MSVVITSDVVFTGDPAELPGAYAPMPNDATTYIDCVNDLYINQSGRKAALSDVINFARTSSKYIVGENGLEQVPAGAPAFPYDPTTGDRLGLLLEESITNLVAQPFNFTSSNWTAAGVTASVNTDPIGMTTLTRSTAESEHKLSMTQAGAMSSAANITTYQIVAKAGTGKFLQIAIPGRVTQTFANFDLESGAVTMMGRGNTTQNCVPYADGSYLCTLSCARGATDDYSIDLAIIPTAVTLPGASYVGVAQDIQIGMLQATAGPIEGPKSIGTASPTAGEVVATAISAEWTAYMEIRMPDVLKGFNGQSVYVFSADDLTNKNFVWVGFGSSAGSSPFAAVAGQKVNNGTLRTASLPGLGIYKPGSILKFSCRMASGKFSIVGEDGQIVTVADADAMGYPLSRIRPGMLINGTDTQRGSGCTLQKLIVWDGIAKSDAQMRRQYQQLSF